MLAKGLEPEATKWQYTPRRRAVPSASAPTRGWSIRRCSTGRATGEIQLQLFYSYGSNPPLYPAWQAYFRAHQPPMLIVWGRNDPIFPAEGAHPYTRDLKDVEFHLLDTGHFALEEEGDTIARLMRAFLGRHLVGRR